MLKVPEMKNEVLAHIVRAFSFADMMSDEEIEEVARALESKYLSHDKRDNDNFAAVAMMLRGYKEHAHAQA